MQGAASAVESLGRTFGPVWGNASLQRYGEATPFLTGAAFLAMTLLVVRGYHVADDDPVISLQTPGSVVPVLTGTKNQRPRQTGGAACPSICVSTFCTAAAWPQLFTRYRRYSCGPDDVAFAIDGRGHRAAPEAVAILRLELIPEVERLVARRELHRARDGVAAHARRRVAVDLRQHAVDRLLVRALIDAVPQVLLRPHDVAFGVHEGRRWRPRRSPSRYLASS